MKTKTKVLLLVIFAATKGFAQITITSSHMPSIGDTIRYTNATGTGFDFTETGAAHQWDFTGLGYSGQGIYKFQALISTPYSTLAFTGMPAGAIGYKVADSIGQGQTAVKNIYNFYEKKSTGWNAVGTGFTLSVIPFPAGGVYSDKDEIYKFPLNYNDYDSGTFQVTTPLGNQFVNLGSYKQKGYRVSTVEGYGTISTPYGNNISCLKVKSVIVETDSLKVPTASLNFGFQNNRVEYKWLSTSEKIPVLEVTGTELGGFFTPTMVRYRDKFRSGPASPLAPKIKFSVNKTTGYATIDTFKFSNTTFPSFGTAYSWSFTPSSGVRFVRGTSTTSATPSVVFDNAGTYSVKLQASNLAGSSDSTATNMMTITTPPSGLKAVKNIDYNIYPNPVSNVMHFSDPAMAGKVCRIFDISGKLILEQIIPMQNSIDVTTLAQGSYTLVITGENYLYYAPFVKQP